MSYFKSSGSGVAPGTVADFAGAIPPTGWLFCYGQEISRATYAALFTAIGVAHGVGNNSTTFNLPDARGRAIFGKDDMGGVAVNRIVEAITGLAAATLGAVGGNQQPAVHSHSQGSLQADVSLSGSPPTLTGSGSASSVSADHVHVLDDNGGAVVQFASVAGGINFSSRDYGPMLAADQAPNDGITVQGYGTSTDVRNNNNSVSLVGRTGPSTTPASSTSSSYAISGGAYSLSGGGLVHGNTSTAGAGSSGNIPPALVLNKIIKV